MNNDLLKRAEKAIHGPQEESKTKGIYTADFEGLIDLVLVGVDQVRFLRSNGEVVSYAEIGEKLYIPPPKETLAFELSRSENILKYAKDHSSDDTELTDGKRTPCTKCKELYYKIHAYHQNASELPDEGFYDVLTAFDFQTHFIEKFDFTPMLCFFAIAERGKTRTGESLSLLCRRGVRMSSVTDAQILRIAQDQGATIFLDMMDLWSKVKAAGSEDVMLNRFQRGLKVGRVTKPEKGPFEDTRYFKVFGPTIIATNEQLHTILETRVITIIMKKSKKIFDNENYKKIAPSLKEELIAARLAHYKAEMPSVPKVGESRFGDIARPLHQLIRWIVPEREEGFVNFIKKTNAKRTGEKFSTQEGELLMAFYNCRDKTFKGVLANKAVADKYNETKDPKYHLGTRRVSDKLASFGFEKAQTVTSAIGFIYSEKLINALLEEYDLTPSNASESSESSELMDDNDLDWEVG